MFAGNRRCSVAMEPRAATVSTATTRVSTRRRTSAATLRSTGNQATRGRSASRSSALRRTTGQFPRQPLCTRRSALHTLLLLPLILAPALEIRLSFPYKTRRLGQFRPQTRPSESPGFQLITLRLDAGSDACRQHCLSVTFPARLVFRARWVYCFAVQESHTLECSSQQQ